MNHKQLSIPNSVLCVAAVKYATQPEIESIIKDGFLNLGWSTVQQFRKIHENLPSLCHHHFIGHLQKNKVNQLMESDIDLIHSVDSIELLEKIDAAASSKDKIQNILLQIKTDPTKEDGFSFEEIDRIFPFLVKKRSTCIKGLMTIPPAVDNPEKNRPIYKEMRNFQNTLEKKYGVPLPYLSMGMSDDYKIAIEEGATIVRLGRILFAVV